MNASFGVSVVDYFRQLSESSARRAPSDVLREVASLFGATDLGFACISGDEQANAFSAMRGPPSSPPWQTDAALRERIRTCWTTQAHTDAAGEWLISLVAEPGGDGRLAWMYRPGTGDWTDADKVLWMFAAQALVRWLHQKGSDAASEQRRLEQAAAVTARLSHDFGNFLTGIMGFSELSLSHAALDSTQHRYLNEVLGSANQGADWIRRLHAFCRRGETPAWPTQLAGVLAHEEARQRAAGMLGMNWNAQLPENLPLLAIDAAALQSAIAEITANSREATRDRGTITFVARARELTTEDCRPLLGAVCPGPCVELSITDDGPGIAAEDRARLFCEIFFSTKPRHRGLGLLAVYGILQRCRGGLRIEPGPAGKGTCIRLYVPSAAIAGPTLAGNPEPPHLLLVHADPLLTSSMGQILEAHGCRVSVASDPLGALTACRAKGASIALVVTDMMLPNLAGLDLARRILEHDPNARFIFLLAQTSFHGSREEDLLKRFDVVRWPVEPAALLGTIQAALSRGKTATESS
jgi:signal transduction histidine kinase/CheY-like chemotaxis protein